MQPSQIDRFLSKIIEQRDGCWLTDRHRNHHGYATVTITDSERGKRYWLAHRLAYEAFIADIPDGYELDHLCRNRWCVNPTHLEPVTTKENVARGLRGVLITPDVRRRIGDSSRGKPRPWTQEWKDRIVAGIRRERAARTHCPRGHAYDAANTYLQDGHRSCIRCRRSYYRRKKQEAA